MGHSESKQENMFLSVFKHMLAEKGLKVSEKTLKDFLDFIKKVSPWFPEEGTLALPDWKRIGKEMREHVETHGEGELPNYAYPLWLQMKELLTNGSDFEGLVHETSENTEQESSEGKPLQSLTSTEGGSGLYPPIPKQDQGSKAKFFEGDFDSESENKKHGSHQRTGATGMIVLLLIPLPPLPSHHRDGPLFLSLYGTQDGCVQITPL